MATFCTSFSNLLLHVGPVALACIILAAIFAGQYFYFTKDGDIIVEMRSFEALGFALVVLFDMFVLLAGYLDAAVLIMGISFTYGLFIMPRSSSDTTAIVTLGIVGSVFFYTLILRIKNNMSDKASWERIALYSLIGLLAIIGMVLIPVIGRDHAFYSDAIDLIKVLFIGSCVTFVTIYCTYCAYHVRRSNAEFVAVHAPANIEIRATGALSLPMYGALEGTDDA